MLPARHLTPGLRRLLALTSTVVLVDTVFYAALVPLLPHYARVASLGAAGAGVLVGAYPAGTLLGALPAGVLATRLGPRRTVVIGVALMSVASVVFGVATSAVVLDCARFVQGVGGAASWAGALAWLVIAAPADRRGELIGAAFGAAVAGALLGPVVGGAAAVTSPAAAFGAAALLGAALIAWTLATPAPAAETPQPLRAALPAVRRPRVAWGLWLVTVAGLSFGVVDVLAPLRLDELGATSVAISVTFLVAAAVEAALSPVVGRISDRYGRLAPLRVSLAMSAVLTLLAAVVAPALALAVLLVVLSPAFGTLFVPATAMVSDGAADAGLPAGVAFGLTNLAWATGMSVASTGAGGLAQVTSPLVPYALLALVCAATIVATRRLARASAGVGGSTDRAGARP